MSGEAAAATDTAKPRKRRRILIIASAVVAALAFAALARAYVRGTSTRPERTTPEGLEPGDVESRIIERDGARWVQLSSVIDAPIAQVWKVVHDHERMTEFMPRMAKLKVLEEQGDRKKVRIDFAILWVHRYTEIDVDRTVAPDQRVERWARTGGSFPTNRGRWVLVPVSPARTFARYEVDVDSGLPIPAWMDRAIVRDALPVVLTKVKERIDDLRGKDPAYLDQAK